MVTRNDDPPAENEASEALIESLYEALAPLREFYEYSGSTAEDVEDKVIDELEKIVLNAYMKGRQSHEQH